MPGRIGEILRNRVKEKLLRDEVVASMTVRLVRGIEIARIAKTAGEDQLMFSSIVQTVPSIQSGSRPALATGGAQRSPILPDLPTIDEAGLPGSVAADWWGIVAPAGTPQPIVDKLHDAIEEVLRSADTMKYLDQQGAAPCT